MERSNQLSESYTKSIVQYEKAIEEKKEPKKSALVSRFNQGISSGGFVGVIVFGSQRIGKSSYGLQVLHKIYGDWSLALDKCLFELDDVISVLEDSIKEGYDIPALMWDDAGCHASKYTFFSNRKKAQLLQSLFDTVGYRLGGIILTTPTPTNLLKGLRDYEFYRVKVTRKNEFNGRNALGYRNILLPSGTTFIKKVFQDSFNVKLPDDIYKEYCEKRESYTVKAIDSLKDYAKE